MTVGCLIMPIDRQNTPVSTKSVEWPCAHRKSKGESPNSRVFILSAQRGGASVRFWQEFGGKKTDF